MLTKRQKQVLDCVKIYQKKNGCAPSLEDIKKYLHLSSVSTVHFHIQRLQSAGYLEKKHNQPRAIALKKESRNIKIPLAGTIAAGQPIEAIEFPDTITMAEDHIGQFNNHYALRVKGDSMIDDGIYDGDIVIIRRQKTAENGQTVVAIIDDNEATLKKIYREKNRFRLQPANPSLFPFYVKEVEIRGVVVKIIRNLIKQIEKQKPSDNQLRRRIDYSWDFVGAKTKHYTHCFHAYPAMFIPQVARRLILTYSQKGDTVCDIFCGSGTALVESRLLGRHSLGIDFNPLAIFLAKVKTTILNPQTLTKTYFALLTEIDKIKNQEIEKPKFYNLEFWFKDKVIIELAKIKKTIKEIKNLNIRNFFLAAFSETVRKSSNTKNGEFKLVRKRKEILAKHHPNVLEIFKQKIQINLKGAEEYYKEADRSARTKIIYGDSSQDNGLKKNSIDCIITSPPYGDSRTTVAYGQFSRLSAQWLDIFKNPNDASRVDNELLGGKAANTLSSLLSSQYLKESLKKIQKKDEKRAKEVLSFYIGLNNCLKRAYYILKPNKYFCLVVGNRQVKQERLPTDFIIAELSQVIGFACEDIIVRNIPNKRMPKKNSPSNQPGKIEETMNKESIVILRKT